MRPKLIWAPRQGFAAWADLGPVANPTIYMEYSTVAGSYASRGQAKMCASGCLWIAMAMAALPIRAQTAEPIQTNSAIPFEPGSAGVKLDSVTGIGRAGGASLVISEGTLQLGVF